MPFKSIAVPLKRQIAKSRPRAAVAAVAAPRTSYRPATAESRREPRLAVVNPAHRYRIGQRLAMSQGGRDISRLASICEVTALLPHETGPLLYRVRSEREGFERVVDEIDLSTLEPGLE